MTTSVQVSAVAVKHQQASTVLAPLAALSVQQTTTPTPGCSIPPRHHALLASMYTAQCSCPTCLSSAVMALQRVPPVSDHNTGFETRGGGGAAYQPRHYATNSPQQGGRSAALWALLSLCTMWQAHSSTNAAMHNTGHGGTCLTHRRWQQGGAPMTCVTTSSAWPTHHMHLQLSQHVQSQHWLMPVHAPAAPCT